MTNPRHLNRKQVNDYCSELLLENRELRNRIAEMESEIACGVTEVEHKVPYEGVPSKC